MSKILQKYGEFVSCNITHWRIGFINIISNVLEKSFKRKRVNITNNVPKKLNKNGR